MWQDDNENYEIEIDDDDIEEQPPVSTVVSDTTLKHMRRRYESRHGNVGNTCYMSSLGVGPLARLNVGDAWLNESQLRIRPRIVEEYHSFVHPTTSNKLSLSLPP